MYGYIYKTTNLINDKYYIGKHKSESFDSSYYGSGIAFTRALKKYGKENFKREILAWCESKEELNEKEKYYIALLRSDKCYNIANGGDGGDIWSTLTEEQKKQANEKRRYSLTHLSPEATEARRYKAMMVWKGKHLPEEMKQKISQTLMGHKVSQETRDKISKIKKDFYQTERGKNVLEKIHTFKKGNIPWNKGQKLSDEYCEIMKQSHPQGYYHHTEETKQKISNTLSGTKHTQQHNDNVSAALGIHVKNVEDNRIFTSITKASKEYHIANRTISDCLKGKRETAGGYHWVQIDDDNIQLDNDTQCVNDFLLNL